VDKSVEEREEGNRKFVSSWSSEIMLTLIQKVKAASAYRVSSLNFNLIMV
jgi:hypothetical protein